MIIVMYAYQLVFGVFLLGVIASILFGLCMLLKGLWNIAVGLPFDHGRWV